MSTWLPDEFFATHWRRRPLLIRGGASRLLTPGVTEDELDDAIARLSRLDPDRVKRSGDDVVFAQRIDAVVPRLRVLAQRLVPLFGSANVGFDGSTMRDGHSIGSHYDYSDNFILQQSGAKLWRLHPPDIIPRDQQRLRMLKHPELGPVPMPAGAIEYTLEPGDLLYIPIFWPHWGLSRGPSTSVSLLVDAESAHGEIVPTLAALLSEDERFWSPLPAVPVDLASAEAALPDALAQVLSDLGEALRDPTVARTLARRWWQARVARLRQAAGVAPPRDASSADALPIDMARVRTLLQAPLPPLDPSRLALPEPDGAAHRLLRDYAWRPYLKRLLVLCSRAHAKLHDEAHRRSLATLVVGVQRLAPDVLRDLLLRPELTSWIWRMAEALEFAFPPQLELLVRHLGVALLPALFVHDALPAGEPVLLAPTDSTELHLLSLTCALRTREPLPEVVTAVAAGDELRLGEALAIPRAALREPARGDGWEVVPLATAPGSRVLLLRTSRWYTEFFPAREDVEGRVSPLFLDIDDAALAAWRAAMTEGLQRVGHHWPAARAELEDSVAVLLPVRSHGLRPHNASVAGFRGLITASARPDYMTAQTLVHEAAHNKLSTLLDVYPVVTNPDDELHPSPFVAIPRPLTALVHGVYSFLHDIQLTRRMLAAGVPALAEAPMDRYLRKIEDRVAAAMSTLRQHARLTPAGEALLAGVERARET
ncbi:HEXXH motif-containing putative peptide modification protein [Nannocystis sp. SCPEA4]|uniref:aKG-HExxH-type peptide beta-hydroxylase n=1 Tax=Nannocystis sp. SCPEA4 TaxID=2996787 RepID=UPI002271033A|nr:HEXXH motif-containing putative peptide modification protein [Nannocystis sp. SCPEA4]